MDLSCYCDSVRWNHNWSCSVELSLDTAQKWFVSREEWLKNVVEKKHAITYELDGGEFKRESVYPDSVSFLNNIEIPQPQKAGYVFAGWVGPFNLEPEKNLVLYGYMVVNDVQLNAIWSKEILEAGSTEFCQLEVFSVKGEFLGYIYVDGDDLSSMSRLLKKAGYASGIYIIRGDGFNKVLRVRDY
jgi:uncharacterized repeat protein (TIGR02543 family)